MLNIIKNLFYIFLPLILGVGSSFFINTFSLYNNINENISFAPPRSLFPIVWTILYLIMGFSYYKIVSTIKNGNCFQKLKKDTYFIYYLQLFVNICWSFIFFNFKMYFFAFIWILLLIFLVVIMILNFYKINKLCAILNLPYLLWIMFASYLNYSIFLLFR